MQPVSNIRTNKSHATPSGKEKSLSSGVISDLCTNLANEYVLLLKTQNCHWNVEGPLFFSLHKLFEEQYTQLQEYVDRTAEVIRAHGHRAPGTFQEFHKLATLPDAPVGHISAKQMVEMLSNDHTTVAASLKECLMIAEEAEDTSSIVLYEDLISFHEKAAWMIRSHNKSL